MGRKATEKDKIYSKRYREIHKEEDKVRHKEYYYNNKEKMCEKSKQKYILYKCQWDNILSKIYIQLHYYVCKVCGDEKFEFHHINPNTKKFTISQFVGMKRKPTEKRIVDVIRELKRCIPLCRPCHQKLHDGIRGRNSDGTFR